MTDDEITNEGRMAIFHLMNQYPQFGNAIEETKKWLEVIDNL